MVGTPKKPAGKSVRVVQTNNGTIKQELDAFKKQILVELAKILGEVQAAKLLGYTQPISEESDDIPVFVPTTIAGTEVSVDINIETQETEDTDLDDAAKALKELKRKKKES